MMASRAPTPALAGAPLPSAAPGDSPLVELLVSGERFIVPSALLLRDPGSVFPSALAAATPAPSSGAARGAAARPISIARDPRLFRSVLA
jgi:hypothetical protein